MAEHPTAFNPTPVDPRQVTSAQPRPNPGNVYGDKSVPVSGWNKIKDGLQRLFPGGPYAAEYGITDRSSVLQVPYSADPVPEPVAPQYPPEQTTASIGASGTPILAGFVEDLGEYNSKLSGQNAFPTYEKMRRSDPDVAAGLLATKLPIKAARAEIVPGAAANAPDRKLAVEVAEFVKENLFGGLETMTSTGFTQTQTFESVVDNALLMLDFGCACDEILWTIDGNHVRARQLAARLPMTFFRYWPDSSGDVMLALEQYGYRGASYVNVIVPAEKIDYYIYRKEGAIFTGRSALRETYQPWYLKSNLLRIDSVGLERNAMGVPHIQLPQPHTREDKEAALNIVTRLAVHQNTGVVTGAGMNFNLVGTTGRIRDPKLAIQFQSEQILRAFLAGFIAFGTTQTGARNLGAEMVGFFKLGLNAIARLVSGTITHGVIRKLVDYNFGDSRKKIPYPQLKFANIVAIDFLDAVDKIKGLGQWQTDFIQPSDELENTILQELGFPLKTKPRVRWMPAQIRDMLQPTTNETVAEMEYGTNPKDKDDEVGPIHPASGEPGQASPKTPKPGTEPRAKRTEPKGDVGPMQPAVPAIPKSKMPAGPDVDAHKKSALKPPGSPARNKDFKATEQFLSILKFLATDVKTKEKWAKKRGMVDFDGVLNKHPVHDFVPGQFGELIPEGKKFVEAAQAMGYEVHVLTARKDHKDVMGWLLDHGVKVAQVTSKKIPAAWYVDDRGAHFSTDDPNAADQVLAAIKQIEEDHREKIPG